MCQRGDIYIWHQPSLKHTKYCCIQQKLPHDPNGLFSGLRCSCHTDLATGSEDVITGIVGLIAFFVGGYVASMTSGARDERAGMLDGVLVWAFVSILMLLFSSLGVGQFFGALGDVVGQSRALGDPTTTIDPSQISNTIKSSALGAFLSLLVWALASAAGGWLGARSGPALGRTGRVRRLG